MRKKARTASFKTGNRSSTTSARYRARIRDIIVNFADRTYEEDHDAMNSLPMNVVSLTEASATDGGGPESRTRGDAATVTSARSTFRVNRRHAARRARNSRNSSLPPRLDSYFRIMRGREPPRLLRGSNETREIAGASLSLSRGARSFRWRRSVALFLQAAFIQRSFRKSRRREYTPRRKFRYPSDGTCDEESRSTLIA